MLQAMFKLAWILNSAIMPVGFPLTVLQRLVPGAFELRHIIVKVYSAFALFFTHMSVADIVKATISSIVNALSMHFISFPVPMIFFAAFKLVYALTVS